MALPNEINVGRFNRSLQRLFQIKGQAPAPQLVPEIQANVILENDRPEQYYLQGGRLAWGRASIAAAVGFRSQVLLVNPVGSGSLVVLEWVLPEEVTPGTAVQRFILFSSNTQGGADVNAAVHRDGRNATAANPGGNLGLSAQIRTTNTVGLIAGTIILAPTRVGETPIYVNAVLRPGDTVTVAPIADNLAVAAAFGWRERAIEQSEV